MSSCKIWHRMRIAPDPAGISDRRRAGAATNREHETAILALTQRTEFQDWRCISGFARLLNNSLPCHSQEPKATRNLVGHVFFKARFLAALGMVREPAATSRQFCPFSLNES